MEYLILRVVPDFTYFVTRRKIYGRNVIQQAGLIAERGLGNGTFLLSRVFLDCKKSVNRLIGFTAEVKPAADFGTRRWRHRLSLHGPAHAESGAQRASRLLSMNTAIKTVTP